MPVRIRPGVVGDAEAISDLIVSLAKKFITPDFTPEGTKAFLATASPEAIRSYFEQGFRYSVAEERAALVGVVATRDDNHLYHLFVAESAQGRGLARRLWETARAECVARGNSGPFTVNSSRYAEAVYRRFGFVRVGDESEQDGVVVVPMRLEPDVV
ncbi:MAG: GNAT family N-acetyltransferase [Proteobacteria bacterium]|nr:GNAT family N-acetyltransferase [Pseudomonadota bacterium]